MTNYLPTRGERNNNPTNIRVSAIQWQGLAEKQTDPDFCQFVSSVEGIRAALINLHTHAGRLGVGATVKALCAIWAPPTENNTDAYVKAVCENGGIFLTLSPDTSIRTPAQYISLCRGIIFAENGRCIYSVGHLIDAWNATGIFSKAMPAQEGMNI